MTKTRVRTAKTSLTRSRRWNEWLKAHRYLVAAATFIAGAAITVVGLLPTFFKPEGSIEGSVMLAGGPISRREECTADGWFLGEMYLYGVTIINRGERLSTVSAATVIPPDLVADNMAIWATNYFFADEGDFLSTIAQLSETLDVSMFPVNLTDPSAVSLTLPIDIEPGATRVFVTKIWITLTVSSGDPYQVLDYRRQHDDWRLVYHLATSDGALNIDLPISQVPVFGDLILCPPSAQP